MKTHVAARWFALLILALPLQPANALDDELRTPHPQYGAAYGDPGPAVRNARALMNALQFSRALNNVIVFEDYGSEMTTLINDFAGSFTDRFLQSNPYPSVALPAPRIGAQQAVLRQVLTRPAVSAQIARIIGDAVLRYAAAVLPSSLSDFYMELGGQRLRSGQMVWMNNGQFAALKFFVVPHFSGTTKHSVPTLGEVAKNIIETVIVPLAALPPPVKDEYIRVAERSVTEAAELAMVRFEARAVQAHVDINLTLLNRAALLDRWLKSAYTMTMSINPGDLPPVEVGDPRVVVIGTSSLEGTPAITENNQILNSPNWNRHIHAISSGSGKSVIAGFIQPAFEALAFESQKTTFNSTIIVRGQDGPPAPSVSLTPQSVAPAAPALPRAPFSVDLPLPSPQAVTPSEPPAWSACGKPGDGGTFSPYTHQCEYAKGGAAR